MEQLKIDMMLLCDYAMLSKEGKASAIGIFDILYNAQPPIILNKGFLVTSVSGAPSTNYALSIKCEHGNKKENLLPDMKMSIQTNTDGKANIMVELQGLRFPQPGNYSFRIYSNDEEIGSKELKVIKVKENNKTQPN